MHPFNSSTSSFDGVKQRRISVRSDFNRRVGLIVLWTVTALVGLDLAIGLAFRLPNNPSTEPSSLQRYFDYGRSIEGKLRRLVGATPERDAPIVRAGWLSQDCDIDTRMLPDRVAFDIYGMSFTGQIADHMEKLDRHLLSQRFGGPAAPLNHSYACVVRRHDDGRSMASIQILGILASSVSRMQTIGGLTSTLEGPEPFTYPRYRLDEDGHLTAHEPKIKDQNDLRVALADPRKWSAFKNELGANDVLYSRFLFDSSILDKSVIARMIRRAWGQRFISIHNQELHESEGFAGAPEIGSTLRTLLVNFAAISRSAGQTPFILLIEDHGFGGSLEAMSASTLKEHGIDFISTSDIVSPEDPGNFLPDGHFLPTANEKIARVVLQHLEQLK